MDQIGVHWAAVFPEAEAASLSTLTREVRESGRPAERELRVPTASGERYWQLSAFPIALDGRGTVRALCTLIGDITDRKQAEAALRESEQKGRAIFDLASGLMGLLDPGGRILDVNRSTLEMAGVPQQEIRGMRLWEAPWWRHSEAAQAQVRAAVARAALGESQRFETTHCAADGTLRTIDFSLKPMLDGMGQVRWIIPEARDITGRKQAEEALQFRNLLLTTQQEASIDGILVVDEDGRILTRNRRFTELWGIPPGLAEANQDEPLLRFVTTRLAEPEAFLARVQHLYEHRQETSRDEFRLVDGRVIDRYSAPLMGPGGRYHGRIWFFRDITERQRTVEALRESERKARAIFDLAHGFMGLLTPEGRLLEANRTALDFAGRALAEVEGQYFWEGPWWAHSEQVRGQVREAVARAARGELVRLEVTQVAVDTSLHVTDLSIKPILDEAGRVALLLPEGWDITEEKVARRELERSEERFQKLFDESPFMMVVADWDTGRFVAVNRAYCERTGRRKEDLLGRTPQELSLVGHSPEGRARLMASLEREGRFGGEPLHYRTVAGETRTARLTAHIVDIAGQRHVLSVLEDITDQLKAEEELQRVVDNVPCALYQCEAALPWRIRMGSEGLTRLTGRPLAAFLEGGLTFADLIHPEDVAQVARDVAESQRRDLPFETTYRIQHAEGDYRWLLDRGRIYRDQVSGELRMDGVLLDIHAQKVAELTLLAQGERLRLVTEATGAAIMDWDIANSRWVFGMRWGEVLGCDQDELPQNLEQWQRIIHPADWSGVQSDINDHLEGRTPSFSNEHRLLAKDGQWIWVHVMGAVVARDASGRPLRFLASMLDVSARKAAQDALEASQATFSAIFRQSQAAMALSDWPDGHLLEVNEAWEELTGYTRAEILGRTSESLGLFLREEQRNEAKEALWSEGLVHNREFTICCRDGRERIVLWSARIFDIAGILRRVSSAVDITDIRRVSEALQATERHLRTLFEGSPIGIFRSTPEGRFLQVNSALATMFVYDDPGDMLACVNRLGIPAALYEHPEQRLELVRDLTSNPGAWRVAEVHFRRKDGSFLDGIMSITLRPSPDTGQPLLFGFVQDISERKRSEQAILEAERRLRTIVEGSPIGIFRSTLEGQYLQMNPALAEMFRYPDPETMMARVNPAGIANTLYEHPEQRSRMIGMLAGEPGTWWVEEVHFRRADDTFLDGIMTVTLLPDAQTGRLTLFGFVQDISQRKRAETELRESAERLRSVIAVSNTGVWEYRRDLDHLWCSPEYFAMLGYAPEEFGGRGRSSFQEVWVDLLHPEDRDRAEHGFRAYLEGGSPGMYESHFRMRARDGSWRWIWSRGQTLQDGQGALTASTIGTHIDITEQKHSEQEIQNLKNYLSNIIDSMPSMLVGLDEEGRITQWNRQAEVETGVTTQGAIGHSFRVVMPDFSPWIEALRAEVHRQGSSAMTEKLLIERGGERHLYDLMLYPLIQKGIQGAVVRIEDVTERARIQELMVQTEKMMSVGGLAAGMAHEINNPLGIISQATQNIARRLSAELPANRKAAEESGLDFECIKAYFIKRQIPEFVDGIQVAVTRCTRIIGNMLQFSRRSESIKSAVSLNGLLEQTLELAANDYDLKKKYDFRSIELVRDYRDGELMVPVVAVEIEQVILNILKNAAQAMTANSPERPPKLTLRIHRETRFGVLEIEDNGPGMEESVKARLFEPFFTTKEPGAGTGLGLSVSYTIITQNHKGLIEVRSAPGEGACFTLRLPIETGSPNG